MTQQRLIVIGNGMVGHKFLESLHDQDADHLEHHTTVICEETRPAYDRVQLSSFFSGKSADDLSLVAPNFFDRDEIDLQLNARALQIDRERKLVHTSSGDKVPYDKLVLATGSYPFVPPIPGKDRPGCHVYRTLEDLEKIRASAKNARVGVVVGGGLLGLEAAKALRDLGLKTHVVEFAPRLMAVQLDDAGGTMLRRKIEALGVQVHTEKNTKEIVDGQSYPHRMVFADGDELETDLIVFSAGIRPRDEIAREAGLEVGPRGGVVIDDHCATSDPNIFAIGEVALWGGRIYGLVAPGYAMARVAAAQVIGNTQAAFRGADMSTKLKLMGVDVASIGDSQGRTEGCLSYSLIDERNEVYKRVVTDAEGKKLLGAVLVGDTESYNDLLQTMLNELPLPPQPEALLLPGVEGDAVALDSSALPDSAQVCSCNSVSKGDLCAAIESGAQTLGALKDGTRASTTCGGCAPLVTQILNHELTVRGIEVNRDICPHFPFSRQDLYYLVRVEQIKTFDALLAAHGRGRGCEICKPAVASILASCWNEHILEPQHAPLQDTNDRHLANMQKDGTYSIVPRVAGGEITPEKLIVLGEVARDYDLYTKITGGQRVDLFGARLDQLPEIWERLIAAGFESGHAYGKALRTVKSCVGNTWCRYGVQDSVGMAVLLENRYKGLRAPHKLKLGVSGCTRECAEAQAKDVGVIATEKGWNLYVCGNGGVRPRHAELFASDLDDLTLIRTIDRFLMFYVRTADRLQRTSVWREQVEGGLDYLKEVVLEDRLGICGDLEVEMQHIIDTYQCEWKTAVETPEKRSQFKAFLNTESADQSLRYVRERNQRRPARSDEQALPVAEVS